MYLNPANPKLVYVSSPEILIASGLDLYIRSAGAITLLCAPQRSREAWANIFPSAADRFETYIEFQTYLVSVLSAFVVWSQWLHKGDQMNVAIEFTQ